MPTDYLGYVTWLHKLVTDVRVAGQRKNLQTSFRLNPAVKANPTPSPKSQPSRSSAFSYQPSIPSQATTLSSPFSVPLAVQILLILMELDSSSRPRGPLTEAKKQFQKHRDLCNYCGTHALGTTCTKFAQQDAI